MLTRHPFVLALLISSLIANIAQFISPRGSYQQDRPPGENRSQQTEEEKTKAEARAPSAAIQIECDPNCAAQRANQGRSQPGTIERYFEKTIDDPVAGFTGLLFIATVILAMLARNQVKDSRAIQRAHVFITTPRFEPILHENLVVGMRMWVVWKNSGTTPAYPIRALVTASFFQNADQFQFGITGGHAEPQPFVLGPGAETSSGTVDIGAGHFMANMEGQGAQFLWGWARFRDIFPKTPEHVVEFCYRVTIEGHLVVGGGFNGSVNFIPHGEHNRYYDE